MHRPSGQLGFADHLIGPGSSRSDAFFASVERVIDWKPFETILKDIHSSPRGRPSFTPLMLFKIMLLQRWYDLSDPAAEDAVNDRKSFARFVGLPVDARGPDHSVICRFRLELLDRGLMQPLFGELARQIEAAGLVLGHGTLMDATLIRSAARPPAAPKPAKPGKAPQPGAAAAAPQPSGGAGEAGEQGAGKLSRIDPDARWARKGRRASFGYKLHLAADAEHRIVRRSRTTPANVNDCTIGPDLVVPGGGDHYGDKGYDSTRLDEELARHGLGNGIMDRANKHHALSPAQRRRNRLLSGIRAAVEGVFAEAKRRCGLGRARYIGLSKVAFECDLVMFAFNLKAAALAVKQT